MTLQKRIFYTFIPVIVLPAIIFFIVILQIGITLIEKRTLAASELVVRESVKRIDILLNNYNKASMQIYYNQNIIDYLYKTGISGNMEKNHESIISEILDGMVNSDKYLMSAILRSDSFLIMRGTKFHAVENYFTDNQYKYIRIPGRADWLPTSALKTDFGVDGFYFGMMRLIRKNNREIGTLLFFIREDFFDDIYAGSIPDNLGNDYVLDAEGIVISAHDKSKIGTRITDFGFDNILSGKAGSFGYIPIKNDQKRSYFIFARSKETGWYFIRELEEKNVLDTILKLRTGLIAALIIFSLLLIFLLYFFSKGISRPINLLAECVDKIGSKNLAIPEPVKYNRVPDEIIKLHEKLREMSLRIEQLIDEVAQTERLKTEAELKALRNHISPHFIYNTLDTIKWMAIINKQENIQKMVVAMDKLMRYASDYKKNLIPLEEELDLIKEYVLIQQMRYSDINLIIKIPQKFKKVLINKFMIQTIVENSIIHGFKDYRTTGTVKITASSGNGNLILTIKDNGKGFNVESLQDFSRPHTGLASVERRLHLNYGPQFGIKINSIPKRGTTVVINLPIAV
ncbi:histidine kinase [Treponema sp. HNW]|uniref:cache domain-containing sensor histidine kinase n=1 Tax=Treponema sp. HNW TaxID=3116654 RepID=UPI003D0B884E